MTTDNKTERRSDKKRTFTIIWAVCAILCVLYGIKVLLAGSGTAFFAVWLVIGAAFAGLAFMAKRSLWKKLPAMLRRIICVVLCLVIAVFLFVEGLIMSRFFDKGEPGLDYIIILGAQVYENGPSPILEFRLNTAIDYLRENPDTICIVSGGQGYNEPFPEAVGMAAYLEKKGIPADMIIQEPESESTEENIRNSMAFIPEGASVGIVTNNFHVYRAVRTAEKLGLENVSGIAAYTTMGFIPNNMLREFFGVLKFALL